MEIGFQLISEKGEQILSSNPFQTFLASQAKLRPNCLVDLNTEEKMRNLQRSLSV